MTNYRIISSEEGLADLVKELNRNKIIAIDLESDMNKRFGRNVSLIQIGNMDEQFLVDSQEVDASPLNSILENPAIEKIFFSGVQDIQMLKEKYKCHISNIFDASFAYQFLPGKENDSASLERVLDEIIGVYIAKKKSISRCDWSRRPMTPEMMKYAAHDVEFLIPLRDRLTNLLKEANRFQDALRYFNSHELIHAVPRSVEDTFAFLKIKGFGNLPPESQILLKELFKFRNEWGKRKNRPTFFLLSNASFILIAKEMPTSMGALHELQAKDIQGRIQRTPNVMKSLVNTVKETVQAIAAGVLNYEDEVARLKKIYKTAGQQNQSFLNSDLSFRGEVSLEIFHCRMNRLENWGRQISKEMGIPSKLLLSRYSMQTLASKRYNNVKEIPIIPGVDQIFLDKYGNRLEQVIKEADSYSSRRRN